MAIGKLFIGRKVRDIRQANGATQAQFADMVGISTSYLNQIENNQRPVSASVLLSLAGAALIAGLPTMLVYILAGQYFVKGLTAGAVKG